MTLHLIKLCVGASTVDDLRMWQRQRIKAQAGQKTPTRLIHKTRQMPKRRKDLSSGGSIYWVIKGAIQVRQKLLALSDSTTDDGRKCCELVLGPKLVLVQPVPRRAFQGWRYLLPDDAPPDLTSVEARALSQMPAQMRRELLELVLI